jgi:hypothetical protein
MNEFFASQLDFIYLLYGLSFVVLAAICLNMFHRDARLWIWMGAFGLMQGLNEWLESLALGLGDSAILACLRCIIMASSFVLLIQFARSGMRKFYGRAPGRWIFAPLLILAGTGGLLDGLTGLNATCRYALGLPGAIGAAVVLLASASRSQGNARFWLRVCGVAMGAMPPHRGW